MLLPTGVCVCVTEGEKISKSVSEGEMLLVCSGCI